MDEPQSVQEIAGPGRLASPVNGAHPRDKKSTGLFCHILPFTRIKQTFTLNVRQKKAPAYTGAFSNGCNGLGE